MMIFPILTQIELSGKNSMKEETVAFEKRI